MFEIPDAAVPFITLQRTSVRKTVQGFYRAEILRDYQEMKAYLPPACASVLDIGAGMAGIDAMLHQHYGNGVDFYLLDRTEVSDERETPALYGFHDATRFYSSLTVAQDLLCVNGVNSANVHLIETLDHFTASVDMVVSLMAWGYHFPLEVYLADVARLLKLGGTLILDLRAERVSQDIETLSGHFVSWQPIGGDYKRKRYSFRKAAE